jgi:hypothetical protein
MQSFFCIHQKMTRGVKDDQGGHLLMNTKKLCRTLLTMTMCLNIDGRWNIHKLSSGYLLPSLYAAAFVRRITSSTDLHPFLKRSLYLIRFNHFIVYTGCGTVLLSYFHFYARTYKSIYIRLRTKTHPSMYKNFVLNLIVNLSWIIWQQTSTTHIFCQIPAVGLECEQYFTSSLLLIGRVSFYHKHGVGSNQFLSVNIGVIRLLPVITTTYWWCTSWRASLYQMNDPPETWCICWRTTSYELMHQASLYQMNDLQKQRAGIAHSIMQDHSMEGFVLS